MSLEPIQGGSGTPSPSNVRPISGHTEVVTIVSDTEDGTSYTTDFGQTVYGGTLDLTTGILMVTHKTIQNDWRTPTTTDTKNRWAIGMSIPDALSELRGKMWAATTDYYSACDRLEKKREQDAQEGEATYAIYGHANSIEWRVRIPNTYTAEEAKAIADASTLCYPCEPFTVQLTPQTIEMIAERLMFKSNANGNIDITYYADGILKTVNGNPVVITDADGQTAEDVTVHFEPIQSGSGTPSPTNIRPISGHTECDVYVYTGAYATPLGRTVYGGTLDVVSGELVVDRAIVDLGTLNWRTGTDSIGQFFNVPLNGAKKAPTTAETANALCSIYPIAPSNNVVDGSLAIGATSPPNVYVRDTRFSDATAFKTAMSGVQLCYELAEPQTYQLTPQQIRTLMGNNVVTAEGADVIEVVYLTHLVA